MFRGGPRSEDDPPSLPPRPSRQHARAEKAIGRTLDAADVRRQRAELVGCRIGMARRANGLLRVQLAELLDDTSAHIALWELGRHEPSAFNLWRLSVVLEVPLWFFFGGPPAGD